MSTLPPPPGQVYKKAKVSLSDVTKSELYSMVEKKYIISQGTLESMISGYNSIFSVFFGLFSGVGGVLWGFWSQCTTEPTKRYYLDFSVISTVLAVLCLVIFCIGWVRSLLAKRRLYNEAKLIS